MFTLHEREALKIATHIAVLDDGRLLQFDSSKNVASRPSSRQVAQIIDGWITINVQTSQTNQAQIVRPEQIMVSDTRPASLSVAVPEYKTDFCKTEPVPNAGIVCLEATVVESRAALDKQIVRCSTSLVSSRRYRRQLSQKL